MTVILCGGPDWPSIYPLEENEMAEDNDLLVYLRTGPKLFAEIVNHYGVADNDDQVKSLNEQITRLKDEGLIARQGQRWHVTEKADPSYRG